MEPADALQNEIFNIKMLKYKSEAYAHGRLLKTRHCFDSYLGSFICWLPSLFLLGVGVKASLKQGPQGCSALRFDKAAFYLERAVGIRIDHLPFASKGLYRTM